MYQQTCVSEDAVCDHADARDTDWAELLTYRTLGELRRCILKSRAASLGQCCSAVTKSPHLRISTPVGKGSDLRPKQGSPGQHPAGDAA